MYVVSLRNRTRSAIVILDRVGPSGQIPERGSLTVAVSDTEWAEVKPKLDRLVTEGSISYNAVRDGIGMISEEVDLAPLTTNATTADVTVGTTELPAGAIPLSINLKVTQLATGPSHSAAAANVRLNGISTFSTPLDILDGSASLGDNGNADQNLIPLTAASAVILRITTTDDTVNDLTAGKVLVTVVYYAEPSAA